MNGRANVATVAIPTLYCCGFVPCAEAPWRVREQNLEVVARQALEWIGHSSGPSSCDAWRQFLTIAFLAVFAFATLSRCRIPVDLVAPPAVLAELVAWHEISTVGAVHGVLFDGVILQPVKQVLARLEAERYCGIGRKCLRQPLQAAGAVSLADGSRFLSAPRRFVERVYELAWSFLDCDLPAGKIYSAYGDCVVAAKAALIKQVSICARKIYVIGRSQHILSPIMPCATLEGNQREQREFAIRRLVKFGDSREAFFDFSAIH